MVEMVVHIFAPTQEEAADRLDKNGGYVGSRSVKLLDAVVVSLDKAKDED